MIRPLTVALCLAVAAALATPALAGAPQPGKVVDLSRVAGRWYQIAHTPNINQRDCEGATSDWTPRSAGTFLIVQTCHRGSPNGPPKISKSTARLVDKATNAKWNLSFFGGLIHQEFWLIDRADDQSWMLFGTPGGHFIWIMSRQPVMDAAAKAEMLGQVTALGYDIKRLVFPAQR